MGVVSFDVNAQAMADALQDSAEELDAFLASRDAPEVQGWRELTGALGKVQGFALWDGATREALLLLVDAFAPFQPDAPTDFDPVEGDALAPTLGMLLKVPGMSEECVAGCEAVLTVWAEARAKLTKVAASGASTRKGRRGVRVTREDAVFGLPGQVILTRGEEQATTRLHEPGSSGVKMAVNSVWDALRKKGFVDMSSADVLFPEARQAIADVMLNGGAEQVGPYAVRLAA